MSRPESLTRREDIPLAASPKLRGLLVGALVGLAWAAADKALAYYNGM